MFTGTCVHEDFGEFPPTPLQCEPPTSNFVVVRVRGLGAWINYWRRSGELLQMWELSPNTVAPELAKALSGFERRKIDNKAGQHSPLHPHCYIAPRPLIRACLVLSFRRQEGRRKRGFGYVLPFTQHDLQITIIGRADRVAAEVLTHEHLHILQSENTTPRNNNVRDLHYILERKWADVSFVRYLLEHREIEARLHEIVLSHYQVQRRLPQTVETFLGMLADWEDIGEHLALMAEQAGQNLQGTGLTFSPRSAVFGGQLGDALSVLKDPKVTKEFLCEVLPVMYGNLLKYYGDTRASIRFHAQILRPNLYDRLYGSDVVRSA